MTSELTPPNLPANPRSILARVEANASVLIREYGSEAGTVAEIMARALIPSAPSLVSAVEATLGYAADKERGLNQSKSDAAMTQLLEGLGADISMLESLLGHFANGLRSIFALMIKSAQLGVQPKILEKIINIALEMKYSALHDELRARTPDLETVKRQGESMLRQRAMEGDILRQVQDQVSATLSFSAPLAGEGVTNEDDVNALLTARGRFERALLDGDLEDAERALEEMGVISPDGDTYRVGLMTLKAVKRDFEGAARVAEQLTDAGAQHSRVKRARKSLTALTRRAPSRDAKPNVAEHRKGSKIGDRGWELIALLGRGGMGSVWRVRNRRGREGAIKLMNSELSSNADFVSLFEAEIDALERVEHSAVIDILDWGQDRSGAWYFVMPFIEGYSLRSRIARGRLSSDEVKFIAQALAAGLVACHAEGVIHRDIKPENIMLSASGAPILIDFGIAHQEGANADLTRMAIGTYAPPEQLAGRALDTTSDLYALGITLAECLGADAGEGVWGELINQLTHFMPARRGTAQALFERLSEVPKSYHAGIQGEPPQGPLSADEVVSRVLAGADGLLLWWPGESEWRAWNTVDEVRARVEAGRRATPPPLQRLDTPPPVPALKPQRNAGDLVISRVKGVEFKMVHCPAGEFWMGADDKFGWGSQDQHQPRHRVEITKPFLIGQTQVTQAQWSAIMGSNPSDSEGSNRPVESVSWFDCVRFCNALSELARLEPVYDIGSGDAPTVRLDLGRTGYRLPTEAEWEYMAKAGEELTYAGSNNVNEVAYYGKGREGATEAVAQKDPNAWGIYDCSGNVCEWCSDKWNNTAYQGRTSPTRDPHEWVDSAAPRVYRGGSWYSDTDSCRVACRDWNVAGSRWNDLSFRLLRCELKELKAQKGSGKGSGKAQETEERLRKQRNSSKAQETEECSRKQRNRGGGE